MTEDVELDNLWSSFSPLERDYLKLRYSQQLTPREIAKQYARTERKDAVINEKIQRSGWHPPQYPPPPDPATKPKLRRLK